ncbi:MAG: 23S rRNA (pseudouridine(1915)-N(3))-methyltransferase RlmH [Oscillospiraceae bacterium]|nr:23S rRNA (pseudouridine(1915)-N(3))-methyltransferase RlmH [Oscillospiraceae bacterium]
MLNINVITVGKLKENYLRDACNEYTKRLGAYSKIKITELAEARLPDNPSEKEIENALENEAKAILAAIPSGSAVIAMCIEGKLLSSEEFSARLEKFAVEGKSTVCLIIGSSFGLSPSVKNAAHLRMSMSPMTFPHQLARVMLLEQLYRGLSISNNGKYHK